MASAGLSMRRYERRPADARDVRPSDVALGIFVAALALGGTAAGVLSSTTTTLDEAPPSFLRPGEVAVVIRPVEVPASQQPIAPAPSDDWGLAAQPVAPRPADAPPPSASGSLPERPLGGIKALPRLAPPRTPTPSVPGDAQRGFGPGGPAVAPGTADPAQSPDDPYAYVDPANEDPNAAPGSGVVADSEDAGNSLATRAVAAYRQRLQRWLSTRFSLTGSGLPKETLLRSKIRAKIEVADDRTVVGYAIEPGGQPAVEAAAKQALDAAVGKQVPALPEHYPGPLQRWVSVTFVCTEATCD